MQKREKYKRKLKIAGFSSTEQNLNSKKQLRFWAQVSSPSSVTGQFKWDIKDSLVYSQRRNIQFTLLYCVYCVFRYKQSRKFRNRSKNDAINIAITVNHLQKLVIKLVGKQISRGSKFSHTIMLNLSLDQINHSSLLIYYYL